MTAPLAALTGGTGFLGRHVAQALAAEGWRLRLLVRRAPAEAFWTAVGAEIVVGDLGDAVPLRRLCQDAQAVVHVAGLVKARQASAFDAVNAAGTARLAAVARECAPDAAFVAISSLAARAPHVSPYARSKRAGELAIQGALGPGAWIVRLPALYGPGDHATLGLFQAAGLSPILPVLGRDARIAILHVVDAARAIAAMAGRPAPGRIVALCDARPGGYNLQEIMAAAAQAMGARPRLVQVPAVAVRAVGLAGDLAARLGATPLITSGKAREILHADWSLSTEELAVGLPPPRYGLSEGFRTTAEWYQAAGWLRRRSR